MYVYIYIYFVTVVTINIPSNASFFDNKYFTTCFYSIIYIMAITDLHK